MLPDSEPQQIIDRNREPEQINVGSTDYNRTTKKGKLMKSYKTEDLNELVFELYPQAKDDTFAKYCYIANLLWVTMEEKEQKSLVKRLKKTLANQAKKSVA